MSWDDLLGSGRKAPPVPKDAVRVVLKLNAHAGVEEDDQFPCGHYKTEENTYDFHCKNKRYKRCRQCHQLAKAEYDLRKRAEKENPLNSYGDENEQQILSKIG